MTDPDRTAPLFGTLHHISLVVENLEQTVTRLERLGFGPFVAYPPLKDYVQLDVPDPEAFYSLRIKVCQVGSIALQVIEAGEGNTIYGNFLRSRGEGVFHLGFRVDDIDSAEAKARERSLNILSSGRRADGSGFTYLDTESELGITLLLRQNPSAD